MSLLSFKSIIAYESSIVCKMNSIPAKRRKLDQFHKVVGTKMSIYVWRKNLPKLMYKIKLQRTTKKEKQPSNAAPFSPQLMSMIAQIGRL